MTVTTKITLCIAVSCLCATLAVAQDTTQTQTTPQTQTAPQTQTNTPQTQVTPQTQATPQDAKQAERARKEKGKQDKQAAKDAQQKAKADVKAATATGEPVSNSSADQALMQIEQELLDALLKGDTSAGERYLADTFTFTAPDGAVQDKARFIADVKSGDLKIESSTNEDMKVQVHGDTAVVTYRSTDKGNYKGNDLSGQYRWTDVFVKRNGRWQIVAGQGTRIMQQQPTQ